MPSRIPDSILEFSINSSDAAMQRPLLAAEAGRLFALWANVEFALASMSSVLLGDDVALVLLDRIRGRHQQFEALRSATAQKINHPETLTLLNDLFRLINRAARSRNKLAHCVWGTISELPDALLLTEVASLVQLTRKTLNKGSRAVEARDPDHTSFESKWASPLPADGLALIGLLRDGTEVWRQADFDLPRSLLTRSVIALTLFATAVSVGPDCNESRQARRQLSALLVETESLQ